MHHGITRSATGIPRLRTQAFPVAHRPGANCAKNPAGESNRPVQLVVNPWNDLLGQHGRLSHSFSERVSPGYRVMRVLPCPAPSTEHDSKACRDGTCRVPR